MSAEFEEQVEAFAREVRERFPSCPPSEALAIARRACEPGSGRVGTSDAVEDPIRAAVVAHIRHQHTFYEDDMFIHGNREVARGRIQHAINDKLREWQQEPRSRRIDFS